MEDDQALEGVEVARLGLLDQFRLVQPVLSSRATRVSAYLHRGGR